MDQRPHVDRFVGKFDYGRKATGEGTLMPSAASLVHDLLTYIEHVEKLKTKPAFSVPTEYFVAHQHDLKGLPELQFNLQSEGDDIWLRVPRLQEVVPPALDQCLGAWVTLPKSPSKTPEIKTQIPVFEGNVQSGIAKLEDHPDIQECFDWYVENQWNPWAEAERPRRDAIKRYNQLFALQQLISSEGAETPVELVWGIGYATWKKEGFGTVLKHPLIVQSCEVTLNEKTFDLEVRPRDVEPRLETDSYTEMEIPGVRPLEAFWKSFLKNGADQVNPFEASTFEGALKAAVGHLDQTGAYRVLIDDVTPPTPSEKLLITNTWVLFARKRSTGIFLEDIKRLKENIKGVDNLPAVVRSFVEVGDDKIRVPKEQAFRGLSSSESPADAFELYFPMPYNEEQVSIVQKLEHGEGVVVQGPPGTGKTHTIANIICHYLAQGKRVLVTSKGESALMEVLGKLPESIRPLSVALLSDDREGLKQFEHSIQTIASSVSAMVPSRAASNIAALQDRLSQLHAKISYVDHAVSDFAHKHMRSYTFQGKEVSPEDIAKLVLAQADEHQWMDDDLPSDEFVATLPFDEAIVSALRKARLKIGESLSYLASSLPMADAFPAWSNLLELHRDLVRARSIERDLAVGAVMQLADSTFETFENAKKLIDLLDRRQALKQSFTQTPEPLLDTVAKHLGDMKPDDVLLTSLLQSCRDVEVLEGCRQRLIAKAVEIPNDADLNPDFMEAVTRLVAGKSAFALPFGKGEARKLVGGVTVLGSSPRGKDGWTLVQEAIAWRKDSKKVMSQWNAVAAEFGIVPQTGSADSICKRVHQLQRRIIDLHKLTFDYDAKLHGEFERVFGKVTADKMWDGGEAFVAAAKESLQTHVDKGRLAYAMNRVSELVRKLEEHNGPIVVAVRSFLTGALGNKEADENELHNVWLALQAELNRLASLRPAFDTILHATGVFEKAGAPKWATRLRTCPAAADHDPVTPSAWREAWNWRCAVMFLERIDGHDKMRELFAQRKTLTTALARTYQDLVAEKTWLAVYHNSPDSIRQALQNYLTNIQAMGHGTGKRAHRYRGYAREAMTRAYKAVPCWILPEWRISETIPAEVGLFDLVIIDEASQSDIWAFPALMRGKKLLVVGDHKQVSPSAIGVPEEKIKELSARFLQSQPHGALMTPERSIYDLASVVFAGSSVMLKEHFRCVPAIIEFSNREFYKGDIKPLRLPHANERLDPPLIDVFVKGGYREGDVNKVEAQAIIDEVEAILADDELAGRSIGIVTLLGQAQSAYIQTLIGQRISPIDVVARNLAVGPPPVFQGRERDIMLISMVLAPGNRSAQDRADQHQRFNVALSRARDRMYLFRSVDQNAFAGDTLNGKLMRHFQEPFRQDARTTQVLRDRCESGFEFEMFDELVKRGYRVEPQVKCGAYRIDFVVEGREGRRLAVECDGDRFHGPGQWSEDMARQRVLERAGWTFWRCFASSFTRRREAVIQDLLQTLDGLGIEPLGSEFVDNTVWVHTKEVDPFAIEELEAVGEAVSEAV
jgi:very-short-patch-repair endonuclease